MATGCTRVLVGCAVSDRCRKFRFTNFSFVILKEVMSFLERFLKFLLSAEVWQEPKPRPKGFFSLFIRLLYVSFFIFSSLYVSFTRPSHHFPVLPFINYRATKFFVVTYF